MKSLCEIIDIMEDDIKKTKSAGGVVINHDRKILVVNQNGNSWSLPKGRIEDGEDEVASAKREIYEESGIGRLKFIRKLGDYERYRIGKGGVGENKTELKNITFFLFETDEKLLQPRDHSISQAKWAPKEDVPNLLTHPKDRDFFME